MNVESFDNAADADIDDIVRSVATLCLGIHAARVPDDAPDRSGQDLVTASVTISGAWSGSVAVSCSPALARRAAIAMFGTANLSDDEACDALRELANIIGGNFKGLVSSPSYLSLPVSRDHPLEAAGSRPVRRLCFDCEGDLLLVSVLREPLPSGVEGQ